MTRLRLFQLALPLITILAIGLIFELGARSLVRPGELSLYGDLFGIELPPLQLVGDSRVSQLDTRRVWVQKGHRNPERLTIGDLHGILREDPVLGYTFQENARSVQGWWQSNNIGARSRQPTLPRIPAGETRILIFGESYGHGSRVRQDQAWASVLQAREPGVEIVNLAVDGYGMGQAFLRYRQLRDRIDFNQVAFIWVPSSDLWRDINTMRYLGEGWAAYTILPRFVLDPDGLRLVPGPYPVGSEIYQKDYPRVTERVLAHLRAYDRFYLPLLYESPPLIGRSIFYKLVARTIAERQLGRVYEGARWDLSGEATQVDRGIFRTLGADTKSRGKGFALFLLPDPESLPRLCAGTDPAALRTWTERTELLARDGVSTVDLLPEMCGMPSPTWDRGYDGSHYGPRANEALAGIMEKNLESLGWL